MIRFRDTRVHDAQMNHAGNVTQGTAPFIEAQTSKIDQAQTVLAAAETKAKRMGERIESGTREALATAKGEQKPVKAKRGRPKSTEPKAWDGICSKAEWFRRKAKARHATDAQPKGSTQMDGPVDPAK